MKRFWEWLKTHVSYLPAEPAKQADVQGGAVGLRWKFHWPWGRK